MKNFSLARRMLGFAILLFSFSNSPAQERPAAQADIEKQVAAIVAEWETLPSIFDDIEIYSRQIKYLVEEIGEPAVPALIAALDKTSKDAALRLLPFVLRAIDDPRAVPALIRAIPKTLKPPGSDTGMTLTNAALLRFMQANDIEAAEGRGRRGRDFGMGRPVREVGAALRKITGTQLNEGEVFGTFLSGGDQQRAIQRRAFNEVAQNWAAWWKENWKQFVDDPAYAEVGLAAAGEDPSLKRFVTGSNIKASSGNGEMVLGPVENGKHCAINLALSRTLDLPEVFREKTEATTEGTKAFEEITAWAARSGVDLIGTQYRDPQSGKLYYCLRGIGLQAWEIGYDQYEQVDTNIQNGALPPLDAPVGDLLVHYDIQEGRYRPERKATFLFITRDGLQGILRTTAQVTKPVNPRMIGMPFTGRKDTGPDQPEEGGFNQGARFDYKFFYTETEELKREELARSEARKQREVVQRERKMTRLFQQYPSLSGMVLLPGGQPASNAAVLLAIPGEGAILGDRAFEHARSSTVAHTPDDGKFVLPRAPTAHHIYVAHQEGFASVDLQDAESPLSIRLNPWGRIEGTVTINGKPAPDQEMAIADPFMEAGTGLSHSPGVFKSKSDSDGKFVLSNLPPGKVYVSRLVNQTYYHWRPAQVEAGKTTEFTHGYNGQRLTGRLVTSDSRQAKWGARSVRFSTRISPPEPPAGEDPDAWLKTWWQSAEGKARQLEKIHFAAIVQPNGEFHIDDVPPGTYELSAELHEGGGDDVWDRGKALGRTSKDITVPTRQAGQEAFNVGDIDVQMRVILKPGDPAPDFEVKTIDGGSLRLKDFRGKYVLLDFWAVWCGPCRAEMPKLIDVYDSFGSHPKFAMIGLSLDPKMEAPIGYVKKEGLRWHQGFLGDWSKATLPARYGVEGIPATFLIDPEGRIVKTGLRGEEIKSALDTLLAMP